MCDCEEIQGQWKPSTGDWCISRNGSYWGHRNLIIVGKQFEIERPIKCPIPVISPKAPNYNLPDEVNKFSLIWLPRQDQLQEMVPEYSHFGLVGAFYDFVFCPQNPDRTKGDEAKYVKDYPKQFTSMEQLWLAFVMKEKFNKRWDGEMWA